MGRQVSETQQRRFHFHSEYALERMEKFLGAMLNQDDASEVDFISIYYSLELNQRYQAA